MAGSEKQEVEEGLSALVRLRDNHRWIYARTMPKHPHSYILRREVPDDALFVAVVEFIRKFGYDMLFGKTTTIRYLDYDGHRYWTMGDLLEGTILLNKAKNYRPDYPVCRNPKVFKPIKGAGGSGYGHARNYKGFKC